MHIKALLNRAKAYRKLKQFDKAKEDLEKAKNSTLVVMEIEEEFNSLKRNIQNKSSDNEEEKEDGIGIGGGIGGIGGDKGGIGGIGGGSSFATFDNDNYPQLPVRNIIFEIWLKDTNKESSLKYLEGGILYPVPSKKPQYRVFNDKQILDMALVWLDCDVFEKIVSLNVCDLEQRQKEYNGASYINQLSTGMLYSGFKYKFNKEKFQRLLTFLCENDVDLESADNNKRTPLANAVKAGIAELGNTLLKYGADINNPSVKMAMEENQDKLQWVRTNLGALRMNCLKAIEDVMTTLYNMDEDIIKETILNYTLSQYAEDSSVDEID